MTQDSRAELERLGAHYDRAMMLDVRRRTRRAIHDIAHIIHPGMIEEDATEQARQILKAAGLLRGWHGIYVRFGKNTVQPYGKPSVPSCVLGANDIFFIDIGPVWQKWEGDGGETFVTGNDPDMLAAKRDVRLLFDKVHEHWRAERATGEALYRFAQDEAQAMGWELNLDLAGHRLSDFPHSAISKRTLASVPFTPSAALWVLEIHIRHPTRPFGAFYEDMLLDAPDGVQDLQFG